MSSTIEPMAGMPVSTGSMLMRNTAKVADMMRALDSGATLGAAAEFAGLRAATVLKWVSQGERLLDHYERSDEQPLHHEQRLMELAVEVAQRTAKVEMKAADTVMAAVEEQDWKAAAWILERRFKHNGWSPRTEVTGADGGALQVEDEAKTREKVETALEELHTRINDLEGRRAEVIIEAEEIEGDD